MEDEKVLTGDGGTEAVPAEQEEIASTEELVEEQTVSTAEEPVVEQEPETAQEPAQDEEEVPIAKLAYDIKEEELGSALIHGNFSGRNLMMILAMCAVATVGIGYCIYKVVMGGGATYIFLAILCLVMILLVTVLQVVGMKMHAKQANDGHLFRMKVFPNKLEMGRNEHKMNVELDGRYESEVYQEMLLVYLGGKNLIILPKRSVSPKQWTKILEAVQAGTKTRGR